MAFIYFYSSLTIQVIPTKYRQQKGLDLRKALDKIFWTHETHEKTFQTHEIPMSKTIGPMKYPREKISDRRRHDGARLRDCS